MKSKSDYLIVLAKEAGYYADVHGNVYRPDGVKLTGGSSKPGKHLNFIPNVVPRNQRSSVLQHRFVAYFFWGEELFKHELVRHKNDIPYDNRIANLCLGSAKDNRADIPKEKLSAIAKRNTTQLVERSRKLSNTDIRKIREERITSNTPYHVLAKKYGVTTMTAYRCVNKQAWSNV